MCGIALTSEHLSAIHYIQTVLGDAVDNEVKGEAICKLVPAEREEGGGAEGDGGVQDSAEV